MKWNGFLFYSPLQWKMWEAKCVSSLLCICQHISRRPGHIPGTGWLGNRDWRSPRLGGLLLSLWLNFQAGRAGAAPNDSWVGPLLPLIPCLPSSQRAGLICHILLCTHSSDHRSCVCAERCSCNEHLSQYKWGRDSETSHPALPRHAVSYCSAAPPQGKMLVGNPAFREYTLLSRGSHPLQITSLSHDKGKT